MSSMTPTNTEALAALLESRNGNPSGFGLGPVCDQAAAELRRLSAVEAERDNLRHEFAEVKRQAECAAGMAELVRQRRDALETERDALRERLRMLLGAFQGSSIEWQAEQMRLTKELLAAIDAAMKGTP